MQWNTIYKEEGKSYRYYSIEKPHRDLGRVIGVFKRNKIRRVLDLGCGAGRNLVPLAESFDAYGTDLSKEGLKLAKEALDKKGRKATLKQADMFGKLPFKDGFFDGLVCVQALQHGKKGQIMKAIGEIKRVLSPNGLVFVTLSGRISEGKVRYLLVKTAKRIAPHTYVPTLGNEAGLVHFIYTKKLIFEHFRSFSIDTLWKDERDYYCFIARRF